MSPTVSTPGALPRAPVPSPIPPGRLTSWYLQEPVLHPSPCHPARQLCPAASEEIPQTTGVYSVLSEQRVLPVWTHWVLLPAG